MVRCESYPIFVFNKGTDVIRLESWDPTITKSNVLPNLVWQKGTRTRRGARRIFIQLRHESVSELHFTAYVETIDSPPSRPGPEENRYDQEGMSLDRYEKEPEQFRAFDNWVGW